MRKFMMAAATLCCMTTMLTMTSCGEKDEFVYPYNQVWEIEDPNVEPYSASSEKQLPVNRNGQASGMVNTRTFKDHPGITYISLADFQNVVLPGTTVNVTRTSKYNYILDNGKGKATVNTETETITFDDYMAFTNLMDRVQPGMDNTYLDGAPFVRYSHQTVSGGSPVVTFDLAPYGIDLISDGKDVYFPFATLADIYSDLYYHNVFCDGEKVIVCDRDDDNKGISVIEPALKHENILINRSLSTAEIAKFAYGELCFVIDHFYGRPGRSKYEAQVFQNGLDKFLKSTEEGRLIKEMFLSTKLADHAYALDCLNMYLFDGGHTLIWPLAMSIVGAPNTSYYLQYPEIHERYHNELLTPAYNQYIPKVFILTPERESIFTDGGTYYKKGNTAICLFDSFVGVDYEAWEAFYNGTAARPTLETSPNDPMLILLDALERADNDPEVKNLVIDLTLNGGGSLDIVVAMTSLLCNQSYVRCENVLTGQQMLWYYDVDRNFDGKFDAQDQDVHYDLNVCVLGSRFSFSCGNLFPALTKEAGLLLAGETTGGGSCAVGIYRTAEGFRYQMSSCRGRLVDENGQNIDSGITPHVPIVYGPDRSVDYNNTTYTIPSFANYYDMDNLGSICDSYYHQ